MPPPALSRPHVAPNPPANPPPPYPADTVSALSPNEIVAIVVGSVVGALLLAALVCLCLCICCRPSRRKREEEWWVRV